MADWSDACEVAMGLIDHEHKHERDAVMVERSYWRDAVEWTCGRCGAEGYVTGISIQAAKAAKHG